MGEAAIATAEQVQSLSKRDRVLAALAAGKTPAEASREAGCAIQYVYGIVKKQRESVSLSLNPESAAELESALKDSSVVQNIVMEPAPPTATRRVISELIWPDVLERVANRLRRGDERIETAVKDAWEAADCFLLKARGRSSDVTRAALVIWPAMWRDYAKRGPMIKNFQVSAESAEMALDAAKVFLEHESATQG
jgi:hypothetical protein